MHASSNELIFQANLISQALRDSGFRDTNHALAELIDNSIQAKAQQIHIYLFSEKVQGPKNVVEQIVKIAVLDNGDGMSPEVLRRSIKFGDGTRLDGVKGLGRFGMGLPASSISQCREMSIWSWQDGIRSAFRTNLSLSAIENGDVSVPDPIQIGIDEDVKILAESNIGRKGTLVVWSDLDRLTPKRYSSLSANTEFIIGRKYRYFLHAGEVAILFHDIADQKERSCLDIQPNDPLYLMAPTITPAPYDNAVMFTLFSNGPALERTFKSKGRQGKVRVKISHVKPHLRLGYLKANGVDAGNSEFGKHAAKNVGFSILREGRELDLIRDFAKPSDPTERWWGVEIDFDHELDDLFEVTTNKQYAHVVNGFVNWDWQAEALENESQSAFYERIGNETPDRLQLVKLFDEIDRHLNAVRAILRTETAGARKKGSATGNVQTAEQIATIAGAERDGKGNKGATFSQPQPTLADIEEVAEEEGIPQAAVQHVVNVVLQEQSKFAIEVGHNIESQSFFSVRPKKGMVIVVINSAHSFYTQVWQPIFSPDDLPGNGVSVEDRLLKAQEAFKLTLMAWARLEDESTRDADRMRETRGDWGRLLKDFLANLVSAH